MSKHIIQLCTCMHAQLHMHIISLYLSEGEEQGKRERERERKERKRINEYSKTAMLVLFACKQGVILVQHAL